MQSHPVTSRPARGQLRALALALLASAAGGGSFAAGDPAWPVVGRQGIVQLVLVPVGQASDRAAYDREIERVCSAGQTCFINFYTNTEGAAAAVPLPDAISSQATATFRRSVKQGAEMFMWSCRMKVSVDNCF